jgi:hypothetical protein
MTGLRIQRIAASTANPRKTVSSLIESLIKMSVCGTLHPPRVLLTNDTLTDDTLTDDTLTDDTPDRVL